MARYRRPVTVTAMKKRHLQRIRMPTPKAHAITIRCHDCGKEAPALLYPDGEELPKGWVGAWVRFRRAYRCPDCSNRIINEILRR